MILSHSPKAGEKIMNLDLDIMEETLSTIQNESHVESLISEFAVPKEYSFQGQRCETHGNKVEAYCWDCATHLCIECVISKQHSEHSLVWIEDAEAEIAAWVKQTKTTLLKANREMESLLI